MLQIARHTDYAARILLHLAGLGEGERVSIAELARVRLLPAPFVRRLIRDLVDAGLVTTTRGASGGIQLARPAESISLLDLVQAMEGPIILSPCVADGHSCPLATACPVRGAWEGARQALLEHLGAARFDVLAKKPTGRRTNSPARRAHGRPR